jgi:hypothetical protein
LFRVQLVVIFVGIEVELSLVQDNIDAMPFLSEDDGREGLVGQIALLEVDHFGCCLRNKRQRVASFLCLSDRWKGAVMQREGREGKGQ